MTPHETRARELLQTLNIFSWPLTDEQNVKRLIAEFAAVAEEAVAFSDAVNEAGNIEDEHSTAIHEAYPTSSGSHDEFALAMKMVGNRFDKGALVALVNWLLLRLKRQSEWDGEHEMSVGGWYHFKSSTVQSYEDEIAALKKQLEVPRGW